MGQDSMNEMKKGLSSRKTEFTGLDKKNAIASLVFFIVIYIADLA
jgi:hypothetical protein